MTKRSITCYPSDNLQLFTVPTGVSTVDIDCVASKGVGANGGSGGRVQCKLSVTDGQILYVMVGAQSSAGLSAPTYNASDIRIGGTELTDRVIVAGGGGNQANSGARGGAGGGLVGGDASSNGAGYAGPGLGGTQTKGGAGGTGWSGGQGHHHNGGQGQFGLGGDGSYETVREGPSGAGGAGWYGGGGGAGSYNKAGSFTAGGGGGSSYTDSELCTDVVHTQGFNADSGYVIISWDDGGIHKYNEAYHGSTHVSFISINNQIVKEVFKGSNLIYELGFYPVTFRPSENIQSWIVPIGVRKIHIDCVASKGNNGSTTAGNGGRVQCDLSVTSGQTLYVMVGGIPADSRIAEYNASDIRTNNTGITDTTSLQSRLIVAGAGGSGPIGSNYPGNGGQGGGLVGGNGTGGNWGTQGYGGTQTSGGSTGSSSSGTVGQNGTFGMGGNGNYAWAGGAGGAGWYGGGGAGNYGTGGRTSSGGGGGGSSYTDENLCSNVVHTQGYNDGAGYVTISYIE